MSNVAITALALCLGLSLASCNNEKPSDTENTSQAKNTSTTMSSTETRPDKPVLQEKPTLDDRRLKNPVNPDVVVISGEAAWDKSVTDKIQLSVTKAGDGNVVQKGDILTVHYRGLLWLDGKRGKEFDSSFKRGKTVDFPIGVGMVIPGWDKSLVGRRIGDEVTIIIPAKLAYGERGAGDIIPPNSNLIFDITIADSNPPYLRIPSEKDWNKAKSDKLQVVQVAEGDGPVVKTGDALTCHYRGLLWVDGKRGEQFDSSIDRGEPATFPIGVGRVIPGWDRSLVGQRVGAKVIVIIPADLAYGAQGRPPQIPGNSTLIFDVEIIKTKSGR